MSTLLEYAATMATGFSTRPLRLGMVVGLALLSVGAVLGAVDVARWAATGSAIAVPLLVATLVEVIGVQFVTLGILGEFLGRVYFRVMPRPTYLIRRELPTREGFARTTREQQGGSSSVDASS